LNSAPILAPIEADKDWYLFTDASREGLGSCMVYYDANGRPVTMGYSGRCLSQSEMNYPINDLEILSVLHALLEWRPWSYNRHITVVTDNVTVLYMNSLQLGTARQ
jgi:RNase H-like domain found in reverse transcriptase